MNLRLLEIFCAVYKERSVSKAAAKLYLTQPTVSDHIKSLEDYFGVRLFDRVGKTILPTKAGDLLYSYGQQVLDLKRAAIEGMKKFLDRLEGELLIGASTIPGEYILPPIVSRFRGDYPGIEVVLRISDTKAVISDVSEGNVEIGFVGAQVDDHQLEFREFAKDELVLVAPNSSEWRVESVSIEELKVRPLIIREPGSGTRMIFERKLGELGYRLKDFKIAAVIGSTNGIKEAIKAGIGASVLSNLAVRDEIARRLLRQVRIKEIKSLPRKFYVVCNRRRFRSPICESFLSLVARSASGAASR